MCTNFTMEKNEGGHTQVPMQEDPQILTSANKIRIYLDKFPKLHNIYLIATISCVSGMMFGFDILSMSAFIGIEQYQNYFNHPNSTMQGLITSAMALGSLFGALGTSLISEPFGRRFTLICCSLSWMIGAAIQSSAQNRTQLILGRIISGVGVGFGSTVAPVYGSELAPRRIRGLIGGLFQFSVTLGILIMYYISYGLHFINGVASFRIAWGLQIIPGLLLFFGVIFLPESPRWLAKHGLWDEAEMVVANVQAKGNRDDPDVNIEVSEIKDQILIDEKSKKISYATLFNKRYRRRTITAVFAQIWQQLTGMNVMMYYITVLAAMSGFTGNANLVFSSIQYVLNVAMTIPALFLLDKVGRRKVLLIGAACMGVFQFALAGILGSYSVPVDSLDGNSYIRILIPPDRRPAARAAIAMAYLFVCSFASSWGVGIWLYCSEIWGDNAIRQRGAGLSTAANWAFNFAIGMYTPTSFKNITWRTYIIYASFCVAMFVHVYFGFPETKGKRLEEIGQMWDDKIPAWKTSKWQPDIPILSDKDLHQKMEAQHVERGGVITQSSSSERNSYGNKVLTTTSGV
ncbi:high affinity glucose transporter [Scheffersomyces spartinae]|uniref:High affinity glucose transporter n=1 Tax=Scheffersomyces spartinae TaxID=45513 RepID=A0A9P7VDX0_9ASCO|nr:high affinity glucose transporter [Scheffersomyces spartinae]KAG7196012.1 high affinity glucose transporter [Scheffersomyces spartinae]